MDNTNALIKWHPMPLVRLKPERPKVVEIIGLHGGKRGTLSIAAHDGWYVRRRKWYRKQLITTHPDHNNGCGAWKFRKHLAAYRAFLEHERRWYAHFDLDPPRM